MKSNSSGIRIYVIFRPRFMTEMLDQSGLELSNSWHIEGTAEEDFEESDDLTQPGLDSDFAETDDAQIIEDSQAIDYELEKTDFSPTESGKSKFVDFFILLPISPNNNNILFISTN